MIARGIDLVGEIEDVTRSLLQLAREQLPGQPPVKREQQPGDHGGDQRRGEHAELCLREALALKRLGADQQ